MSERCPLCAHSEVLLVNEQRRRLALFDIYTCYYKQTLAQAKGIRRLRKQINRLKTINASLKDKP